MIAIAYICVCVCCVYVCVWGGSKTWCFVKYRVSSGRAPQKKEEKENILLEKEGKKRTLLSLNLIEKKQKKHQIYM